jgi:hypothetical protein
MLIELDTTQVHDPVGGISRMNVLCHGVQVHLWPENHRKRSGDDKENDERCGGRAASLFRNSP